MVRVAPGSRPPFWSQSEVNILIYSVTCYKKGPPSDLVQIIFLKNDSPVSIGKNRPGWVNYLFRNNSFKPGR